MKLLTGFLNAFSVGPSHWGQTTFMMYADDIWPACFRGKQQSPINIKAKDLIYDHTLKTLDIEGISSELTFNVTNAGQNVNILLDPASMPVYFKGGPLSYQYRVHGALIKFGSSSQVGSEHQIDNHAFPGEVQMYAFNSDLYSNFSVAVSRPNGVAAISFFLKVSCILLVIASKDVIIDAVNMANLFAVLII
ncbi:hypothetical protein AAHC03_01289 [Spirometra sp. Aus1]